MLNYRPLGEIGGIQHQAVKAASTLQLDYPAVQAEAARQQQKLMTPKQALRISKSKQRSARRK